MPVLSWPFCFQPLFRLFCCDFSHLVGQQRFNFQRLRDLGAALFQIDLKLAFRGLHAGLGVEEEARTRHLISKLEGPAQ